MAERRRELRTVVNQSGSIAIDEHTTMPCVVYDISEVGVRLILLSTDRVPDTFVLDTVSYGSGACEVIWRTDEMIGARLLRFAA